MKQREGWGAALIAAAGFAFWWATVIWGAPAADPTGRQVVFFYRGLSGSSITGWIQLATLLGGSVGVFLLVPALIDRISQRWVRTPFDAAPEFLARRSASMRAHIASRGVGGGAL